VIVLSAGYSLKGNGSSTMVNMNTVYLVGPITGLSYGEATDWRDYAVKDLSEHNIKGISPMRCKEYLMQEKILADEYNQKVLSCAKGITTRDRWDCHRCDAILVNFLGATKVSIGSILEIAWADAAGKPIVLIIDKDNIHQHAMINEIAGFVVRTLDEGLAVVKTLFA